MRLDVETLMTRYGYSREHAELEVRRAACEHDYGTMCESSFLGCFRTCVKCGQKMGLGRHCGGAGKRSTSAPDKR